MKYRVKSQLDHMEKGGILDDCGPSSMAAAVAWASKYVLDPSAGDGIAAKQKATGYVDKQGVADNGSSLGDLIKTVKVLGAKARWAKSWDDVVSSAKQGAAIGVWVQQPIGYPEGVEISEWHRTWAKYWSKKDPKHFNAGYGHMTSAGWDPEEGWQWCCPTRSGKGKEQFAVKVTEDQLLKIADSKRVSGVHKAPEFKHCIIISYTGTEKAVIDSPLAQTQKSSSGPVQTVVQPSQTGHASSSATVAITPAAQTTSKALAKADLPAPEASKTAPSTKTPSDLDKALKSLESQDWGKIGAESLALAGKAAEAANKEKTAMGKITGFIRYITDNSKIDEMLLDAIRTFLTVSISVALGLGIPLLDISGGDFRTILSAGMASALQIIVKALDPSSTDYGVQKKK